MLTQYRQKFEQEGVVYLRVKARPGAASTDVRGVLVSDEGETLKIDVAAAPEQGKANAELIRYLAMWFEVPKSRVSIISGAGDKIKLIKISK